MEIEPVHPDQIDGGRTHSDEQSATRRTFGRFLPSRRSFAATCAVAAAFGSIALGCSDGGVAGAAVQPVSYGTATFCQVVSQPTSTYTWQQELEGTIPMTSTEELYVRPPSQLNDYAGTARLAWVGEVVYLASNGVWTLTGQDVGAVASTAQIVNGTLQNIGWSQSSSFVVGEVPGYKYAVYGITEWLNSAGQAITAQGGYVPNTNCY
jgi:hypothetical protein